MIPTLNRRSPKPLRRPSKAFKQRYGSLMAGLESSLGLGTNEQEQAVQAVLRLPGEKGDPGEVGVGIKEFEQVGRDVQIFLTNGHGAVLKNLQGRNGNPGEDGLPGEPGRDGVGYEQGMIVDKHLLLVKNDETIEDLGRVVGHNGRNGLDGRDGDKGDPGEDGQDGLPGKNGDKGDPGRPGANGKQGKKGKAGENGKDGKVGKVINKTVTINQAIPSIRLEFNRPLRRLQVRIGKKSSNWVVIPGGGGGGLSEVASDATLSGLGTEASPLTVVSSEDTVQTDASISGDGAVATPLSVVDSEVDHLLIDNRGANTHVQIDTHLGSMANPHSVTATQAGADPTGSAAGVQSNLTSHEGDTTNPHSVTAAQASADPAGSAAAVQTNLTTHEGLSDIHVDHTAVSISAGGILSGGGTIASDRTISLAHGDVDHDQTTNFVGNKHIDHTAVTLTAGTGLTGGGDIAANRTFDLEDTAVTPASYTYASLTIDQQGRITAASSGSAPAVDSVFGRTGVVVAVADDYTWAEIDKTVSDIADIATKSHSSLDSLVAPADDHTQYHTNARGDARYALLLHAPRHTDGNDDIQDAGAAQKGLLTSGAQTIGGIKTFNANILPVASIIFQTGGTDLDLATNAARFFPHRASQEGQPTPASGELMMWYKPIGGRVRLVYNDPVGGVKDVMLA